MTTKATPEQALAYLGDLHNLEAFVEEVDAVERSGAGYKFVLGRGALPDLVVDYVVTTPGTAVVAEGTHSSIDLIDRWDVAPAGDGARVRYVGTYELKGLSKVGGPFSGQLGRRSVKRVAERLKIRLDGLAAGPSS